MPKKNIAVLASGKGTNFQALVDAACRGEIKAEIKLLITDKANSFVRKRAKAFGINDLFIDPKKFKSSRQFDKAIVEILRREKIDLVVLAGYMRIISPCFVKSFKGKILNIHPALLPAFKGINAIARAFKYGCRVTGVTVHFVDAKVDHGPIILQEAVSITSGMNEDKLEAKIHRLEHKLYPRALKLILDKKIRVKGRHVKII
jgi:phosphoribosylglycinamide formyltransferase-1